MYAWYVAVLVLYFAAHLGVSGVLTIHTRDLTVSNCVARCQTLWTSFTQTQGSRGQLTIR